MAEGELVNHNTGKALPCEKFSPYVMEILTSSGIKLHFRKRLNPPNRPPKPPIMPLPPMPPPNPPRKLSSVTPPWHGPNPSSKPFSSRYSSMASQRSRCHSACFWVIKPYIFFRSISRIIHHNCIMIHIKIDIFTPHFSYIPVINHSHKA